VSALRVVVDATNLARDRRGMGRYARSVVAHLHANDVAVAFATDDATAAQLLCDEFGASSIVDTRAMRDRSAYDAAWYPFNGMRVVAAAPALVTMHDAFAFDEPARDVVARFREQQPMRRAARRARAIHADSQWSKDRLLARLHVPDDRIAVVTLAPDARFTPAPADAARDAASVVSTAPYALVVGGRERRKNAAFFLRAFADAFGGSDAATLVVVGDLSSDAETLLRDGAFPHRRLRPTDAELLALYRGARVVAVPSLGEGFGLVAVEAQACGAAVVAADASALPEAVGDAGLLVAPTDRAAWTAALRRVFTDDAYHAELAARSRARWAHAPRDDAARSVLAALRTLARDGGVHERA
jgi:glycosyltransferase involved in cell wall biosynthesis